MIRVAGVGDAGVVAKLLCDFNTEFDTQVPGNLEQRFARLLARDDVIVLLAGEVDTDARRFYERHGFTNIEASSRMLLYIRELGQQDSER